MLPSTSNLCVFQCVRHRGPLRSTELQLVIKRLKVCRSSYFVAPKGRVMPHSNLKPSAGARRRHRQQNVAVIYDKFSFLHVPAEMFLCVWDDRWK